MGDDTLVLDFADIFIGVYMCQKLWICKLQICAVYWMSMKLQNAVKILHLNNHMCKVGTGSDCSDLPGYSFQS